MTKECCLREAFIERRLDEFQPDWREGKDITGATKKKIRDYASSTLPEEFRGIDCITDYTIMHMAQKIRARENLPPPKKSNKGNCKGRGKEGARRPSDEMEAVLAAAGKLISKFTIEKLKKAIAMIERKQKDELITPDPELRDAEVPEDYFV